MEKKSTSGFAVASLVLGILAAISSFVPIVNNASFFIAILGGVLAIAALVSLKKNEKSGKGIAIAGLVLAIVSVVIVLATQSFYSAVLNEASNSLSSTTNAATSTEEKANTDADTTQAAEGSVEEASQAKYAVTIDGCQITADYQGNPAALITYTFTNNSDDDASFAFAVSDKAFQNGVQLDTTFNSSAWDNSAQLKEIKPGASIQVQQGYALTDTSELTVEVEDWLTFTSDNIIAQATFTVE